MLPTGLSIRTTTLLARTGPGGAVATLGAPAPARDAASLLGAYRAEVGTEAEQNAALLDRTRAAEKALQKARKAPEAEIARQVNRMNQYLKALEKLGIDATSRPNVLTIAQDRAGLTLQATRGDDRLAIAADRIATIDTGSGADALTVQADRVEATTTDRADSRPDRNIDREAQGSDALAIAARVVRSVGMGGGSDVLAAQTQMIFADLGAGDDVAAITTDVALGVAGGAGDDVITLTAHLGGSAARRLTETADGTPIAAATLYGDTATRLTAAADNVADVDGGAGDDVISVTGTLMIGVAGGTGDDLITIAGRTVALHYGLGDGDDVVTIGAGTDVLVQLAARPDGGADPQDFAITRDGDRLTLGFATGSITFAGVHGAGTIALARGYDPPVILTTPPPPVNLRF